MISTNNGNEMGKRGRVDRKYDQIRLRFPVPHLLRLAGVLFASCLMKKNNNEMNRPCCSSETEFKSKQ